MPQDLTIRQDGACSAERKTAAPSCLTDSKGSVSLSAKQKQNFLHGALILMSATVIVKIIGYFFKVPLKGIIGVSGFGYFNAAYGLFNTLYALSVAGMPVAVARMVAQNMQQGRYRDVVDEYYNYMNEYPEGNYVKQVTKFYDYASKRITDTY